MKKLSKDDQLKFYEEEIKEILSEYKTYLDSKCVDLFNKDELFVGIFEYVDDLRNQVIFSFPKNKLPKTKIPLTATKPKTPEVLNTNFNDHTYAYYRKNCIASFTECYGVYYQESNGKYNIGFNDVDIEFLNVLSKGDKIIFGITDPPLKYYFNLIHITRNELDLQKVDEVTLGNYNSDNFNPINIENSLDLIEEFKTNLRDQNSLIIQGPSGTGKTFFIARLLSLLSNENKTVLVATLANRSLIELAKKYYEIADAIKGIVFKSNLTLEESNLVKELKPIPKGFLPAEGNILLTTFYKMTGLAVENIFKPIYDYVILEEASQCFLGTIAAAKVLGKRIILIGDPLQLHPVVNQNNPNKISKDIDLMLESFTFFASTIKCPKYKLTTTYRFSENACFQTNTFYGNSLKSKSKIQKGNPSLLNLPQLFNQDGGSSIVYYDSSKLEEIFNFLFLQINKLLELNSEFEFAILSSTKKGVKLLRDNLFFRFKKNQDQITINTVDGVQGLTVDFCFYFAYSELNPSFAFNLNRFNVASSRARYCTLILLDEAFKIIPPYKGLVAEFLSKCNFTLVSNTSQSFNSVGDLLEPNTDSELKIDNNPKRSETIITDSSNQIRIKVLGTKDPTTFERPKKELKKDKENLYVIDTNVFVDCPDIITRIDKQYPIILSAKVLDELDNLKSTLSTEGKSNVQKALKSLNQNINKRDLRMEVSDLSLLPIDFSKRSPDNLILTVALKFKTENPIILTSDNGLQLKAKGLKITTITLKDFLKQKRRF